MNFQRVGAISNEDGEVLVDDAFVDRNRFYDRIAVFASESAGPFPARAGDDLVVEFTHPGATEVFIAVDDDRRPLPTSFNPETGEARANARPRPRRRPAPRDRHRCSRLGAAVSRGDHLHDNRAQRWREVGDHVRHFTTSNRK
jgi:hypothetical protein